ncbi:MAG: LPS-assembly protein LptD, partial [Deltaproteobacteria bacterium]|nr:LPS-assembly protein LptD [Deltaproteobacteria bacterium]
MALSAQDSVRERFIIDPEADVSLESISYKYMVKDELGIATGDVVLSSDAYTLSAQKAEINYKTKMAVVSGSILLKTGDDTLMGESGTFNYLDKTGVINGASLFIEDFNFYFSGDRIEKFGDDSYLVHDFKLTTCDGDKPEWSITGSEINVTVEGYGRLRNAAFRVKDIPIVYVPYLLFPAKTKRASGLLIPQAGYSSRNGAELEVPFFWAISDSMDMTFYERYMTERGLMQGLEFRYATGKASKGFFNFDILSDRIDTKDMNDHDQLELSPYQRTNSGRYWLLGRMDQELPAGISARLDADVVSDQDYQREFKSNLTGFNTRPDYEAEFNRPLEEMTSPFRTSRLRLERDGENHSLQAASTFYQRPEGFINDTT